MKETNDNLYQKIIQVYQETASVKETAKKLGRCITYKELPHISEEFSSMNARTLDRVLWAIGYAM